MNALNITTTRKLLQDFEFHKLFIEELGWSQPATTRPTVYSVENATFTCRHIAQLGGVVVLELTCNDSSIPAAASRKAVHKEICKAYHENLLIFTDDKRTQSLWYWVKRETGRQFVREHFYFKGQPGDLFLAKLSSMVIDISDLDENGDIHVTEVVNRLKNALDIEKVIKRFFDEYKEQRLAFTELISGIKDDRDRRWYASIILNRLMFIYFLQGKFFLDNGNNKYLQDKLSYCKKEFGKNKFFKAFLTPLFFEGFAKPEQDRSAEARRLLGAIKYLNGGLFLRHRIEIENPNINIPDEAFENLFALFSRYTWNLDDTPGANDSEMNPDVLGYIFEKYINQKAFGAYYTRPEITEYLSERTIYRLVLDRINTPGIPGVLAPVNFKSISDLLMNLNADLCRQLLNDILPKLAILDPACGSGAFLVAAMKTLINLYSAVVGRIEFLNDRNLKNWLAGVRKEHPSINYYIKKRIITDNLYGVDIMEEATEIAKLRLFLALVSSASSVDELEPLPNIDFNIMAGNSLIGLLKVDKKTFEESGDLVTQSYYHTYTERLAERNRLIDTYRHATSYAEDLRALRDEIDKKSNEVRATLNRLLLDQFQRLGIKYEEATWDEKKNKEGKPKKRALTIEDIKRLKPFHWGFEFSEIMEKPGAHSTGSGHGFDAVVTNPPWEIFKPIAKEFCYDHDDQITRRGTDIKDFEKRLKILLKDKIVLKKWLEYLNQYPHTSEFFRTSPQYNNQISVIDGKKAGTDINLYKLFTEQCFNLLNNSGECGIVIPSGIYSDLGTKRLREMLFEETLVTGLFCFENRREIFENVDSRFKFVVLTYRKGDKTEQFPARFMRHDVAELEQFPQDDDIRISVDLVKKLSPDSLSIMEFKNEMDVQIAKKMLKWPLLGEEVPGKWKLKLGNEFHMTNDSHLFKTEPGKGRLPLYEGKMIWHFEHDKEDYRYWVEEKDGRDALLSPRLKSVKKLASGKDIRVNENSIQLGYQYYRLAYRAVTGATNERAFVVSVLPRNVFTGNSLIVNIPNHDEVIGNTVVQKDNILYSELLFAVSIFSSYCCDWMLRQKILTNMNMFYVYQLPVPRLTTGDRWFSEIVSRAARLICTTPEFDDLAREVGLAPLSGRRGAGGEVYGVTDPAERAKLRAELDGIIAHLYELTEEEFSYILTTFPLVPQPVKDAALEQYRVFAPKSGDEEVGALIKAGESHGVEFKETARWDVR